MDFNPNLKSSLKKAIKIDYNEINKMPKVSNFFRGEIVANNNNNQPKRLSYDKKEIFYTSRMKESELEPKLLLEKLPPAFNLKNHRNSNDSKTTTNTKYSSNEHKNNGHKKLTLNNSNETSPEEMVQINFNKPKSKGDETKKINNFFIEEEINIQKQLQIKKNNNINKRLSPFKVIKKNNLLGNNDYGDKNIFIYNNSNNTNNNHHLKNNFSEYENIIPRNNLLELGINHKYNSNIKNYVNNSTFNKTNEDKYKYSEKKYKLKTININNINSKKNNYLLANESLNTSGSIKKNYRKSSDPETYHQELKELKNIEGQVKKNIRSGSYMNMVNYQILQTDSYYSPVSTNTNVHTITNMTNNNFSMGGNTIKEMDEFKLSENMAFNHFFPTKKNSEKMKKLKSSKYISNNIRSIKNITKIQKIPIITGGVLGNINFNLKYNKNGHNHNHIHEQESNNKDIFSTIKSNKKDIENINEGITFKLFNGYKYYFNLRNANIYFLKEVQYNFAKGVSTSINAWNKIFHNNTNYLNIISRKLNTPENHYTFVIEYPRGGESISDIIDSIGLHEEKLINKIISEIYKNIKILKSTNENETIKQYQNIPFCLCDIFLTINENIKIMPPVIRKIPINSTRNNNGNIRNKKEGYNICQCKKNFEKLKSIFNFSNNSLFCLGLSLIQLVTQNILFKTKSYNYLINKKGHIDEANQKHCCLLHSLLSIEEKETNNKNKILSNFLSLYNPNLSSFIHQCTKFDNDINNINDIDKFPKSDFIDCYHDINNDINISMKELFKIITYIKNNDYLSPNNFFKNFELLYNDMKINSNNFKKLLHENKVINVLIRSFDMDKHEFKNKFRKIISNNENNNEYDEYDENKNFVNSGNCFYKSSLRKKLENNRNKNFGEINLENNNLNEENNKGIIIFKNYNNSENN